MTELILSEEQTRQLATARGPVVVRDAEGTELGKIDPYETEVIRRWKERKGQPAKPGIPSADVRAYMQALVAEHARRPEMTTAEAVEFVRKLGEQSQQ
jgi:hypothetical protein